MAGPVLRDVGPEDVDSVGDLIGKVGVKSKAHLLIKSVAESYPQDVQTAQVLQKDQGRSNALDLEEVEKAVEKEYGKDLKVLDAAVRGLDPDKAVVNVLVQLKSGRTRKVILPYGDHKKSQKAYDAAVEDGTVASAGQLTKDELVKELEASRKENAQLRKGKGSSSGSRRSRRKGKAKGKAKAPAQKQEPAESQDSGSDDSDSKE